ncbi:MULTISPECIES: NAD(P)H-dependent oxidoreductase [Apilactobacillus]|uniref:NAD(P)H-dependent oxidoreductase n=1 Tax=Apilactobacillus timberlakei TaxID=2008380 RepID=A0ABY2YUF7_9LACO|nr:MULTISPECIES: NAD(P)H-dependent oxidoreductase [Apilactobacillus]TPR14783.1 NAD(P)H-dependent oxidoreductase [Apilactobacillus timberlakei]TPR15750.1 NAD(P)H-dependent oxidoreductase [Apilactobacillus timberlakei]TPR16111.1 NAD(P)H-dependent oxidoreductase [Apilactobacillus timberlakei]TPR18197.1 NAD(P)H-dependent oxidoreductase [Apilactobacillus timberlakei]TPR18858.1 NAD(P)H-dependent oxidoreductase [Apilactobacillus timberlakei]
MNKNEELIKVANRRYATKKFNPDKKISDKDWQTIMEVARLSPSSMGFAPWKFLLIENNDLKKDIYDYAWGAQNSLDGADKFVIILAKKNVTPTSKYVQHISEDVQNHAFDPNSAFVAKLQDFQDNDFKLNDERTLFEWSARQTYIPLANMMDAAATLDIDSCPIEGFNRENVEKVLEKYDAIDLKEWGVSVMAGFGYRDQDITPKKRQPMDEIYKVIK